MSQQVRRLSRCMALGIPLGTLNAFKTAPVQEHVQEGGPKVHQGGFRWAKVPEKGAKASKMEAKWEVKGRLGHLQFEVFLKNGEMYA